MAVTLGYWKLRGRGEPIKLMLEFMGIDYKMKLYHYGGAPDFDSSDWYNVKSKLGIKFPNVPYLVDGDVKLTETYAIMRYLARKHKQLYPETDEEHIKCDQLQGVIYDFRSAFTKTFFDRVTFEQSKIKFMEDFPGKMANFESWLKESKWLAGNRLLYIDFMFSEYLSGLLLCFPGCLVKFPVTKKYLEAFEALERIASYKKSERFQEFPLFTPKAMFGGDKGPE